MNILSILSGVLKLANWLAKYAERREMINVGTMTAVNAQMQGLLENVDKAKAAALAVKSKRSAWADELRGKYTRDD